LNKLWSGNLGITLELIKYETDVHPSFSTDPQATINEQIGTEYDVFIGIFWGRLGTPTPRARSGTIEEFEKAYDRWQRTGYPEIMLYFKDAPITPSRIDVRQLAQLQEFKESLSDKGGLYSVFEDPAGFESSLRAHLAAIAKKFSAAHPPKGLAAQTSEPSGEDRVVLSTEDDYGYIDYMDIYETKTSEMSQAITLINEATLRVGDQLRQRSTEITDGTSIDSKTARRFVKRAAEDMNTFAETLSSQVAVLSAARKIAFDALTNALALRGDFRKHTGDLQQLKDTLLSLIASAGTAKSGMSGMRASADKLPRISKELNQAKRSVVSNLDLFLVEIDSTSSTVANIVDAIDRMLVDEQNGSAD